MKMKNTRMRSNPQPHFVGDVEVFDRKLTSDVYLLTMTHKLTMKCSFTW